MSWSAITSDGVKERLSGPELTALQQYVLSSGQTDPLPGILTKTIDLARGYIKTRYPLGLAGTLPPEVHDAAIAIARWRLLGRLSIGSAGSILASKTREDEYKDALALLEKIPKGEFGVERPDAIGPDGEEARPGFGGAEYHDFIG